MNRLAIRFGTDQRFVAKCFSVSPLIVLVSVFLLCSCARRIATTSSAVPLKPRHSSGLYAVDPALPVPNFTSVETTDNAVIFTYEVPNNLFDSIMVTVWDRGSQIGPTEFRGGKDERTGFFLALNQGPLIPGHTYDIHLNCLGPRGVSRHAATVAVITAPTIRVGLQNGTTTLSPIAYQSFGAFDDNNNGIVDSAAVGGGAFPLFPGFDAGSGRPMAMAGNLYDRIAGTTQGNVVVGYFLNEAGLNRFVAYHLFIDTSDNHIGISVTYGDAIHGVPGTLVWVSPSVDQSNIRVINATGGAPNRVQGQVTAPTLASDQTRRIIEFTFNLVLIPQ